MESSETNPDLESFREQWRAEVRARHPSQAPPPAQQQQQQQQHATAVRKPPPPTKKPIAKDIEEEFLPTTVFDEPVQQPAGDSKVVPVKKEPVTALEHYEKAVEREAAGNLGESLRLYRKAFRMDDQVDQNYKAKHFPRAGKFPPKSAAKSGVASKSAASGETKMDHQRQTMKELIAGFAGLGIEPVAPEMEGMPQPPCPMSTLPDEILVHILRDVATADVGDFVRLAQVCKRLAFLVVTEDRIWRRVCLGSEFGFGGMHYYWQKQVTWEPLTEEDMEREAAEEAAAAEAFAQTSGGGSSGGEQEEEEEFGVVGGPVFDLETRAERLADESAANTLAFFNSLYGSSWQRMFRLRPRIRFNGCYISTVNYVRSGMANSNSITWGAPIHVVTYYRYLRFFRDGTCLSLLTTAEPNDVVHHLTRETYASHHAGHVIESALKGRWRLARAGDNPGASLSEVEGDVMVETEGIEAIPNSNPRIHVQTSITPLPTHQPIKLGSGGGPLALFRNIYDLDTLDTRFTHPSGVPYRPLESRSPDKRRDSSSSSSSPKPIPGGGSTEPPKWKTPEFLLYYLVFALAIPAMFYVAYDVSRPTDPRYPRFERFLSDGWIPGRKIDNSDAQYRTFRRNLPAMAGLLLFHPLLRKVWNAVTTAAHRGGDVKEGTTAKEGVVERRFRQRTSFDFVFALVFLVVLHGFSAIKVLMILGGNYLLAKGLPRRYIPAGAWVYNICTLFANEVCSGYKFGYVARLLTGTLGVDGRNVSVDLPGLVRLGEWMDGFGGLMGRWEILFNITVLRLVSFSLDYYWSLDRGTTVGEVMERDADTPKKKNLDPSSLSERDRIALPAQPGDYTFKNYVGYAVYAPLYLTGPIITFNDYISQSRYRSATISSPRTWKYAIRFLLVLLCMELVLHYDYVGAISKSRPEWSSYTPAQISLLSYFNLHIVWLKLLLPWRFFRLWSLVDGIDPPENMLRCMSNNYSALSFWRGWHRSYYRWLLRYIYIPLGGSSFRSLAQGVRTVVTYLVVFTFVALWHDIKLNLLIWGWLVVLFFIPEIVAGLVVRKERWRGREREYRWLCGLGGVGNVLMMISANLVGFAVGLDGLKAIVRGVFRDYSGLVFLATACTALFVGIQVMFEIRQGELRRGINLKC
ncbi:putative glycerol transporter protein [Cercophora samala]|uniref:Glycerol transporter protein n=1 Tax=Cercophora samala TaxID=330535 RepID=A0AA40DH50_9PEZI|nr:putative glycerol transporter protein [Cercophora samala]